MRPRENANVSTKQKLFYLQNKIIYKISTYNLPWYVHTFVELYLHVIDYQEVPRVHGVQHLFPP